VRDRTLHLTAVVDLSAAFRWDLSARKRGAVAVISA